MSSRNRANVGMRASNLAGTLGINDPRLRRAMQDPDSHNLGEGLMIDEKGRIALDFSTLSTEGTREIMRQINTVVRIDRAIMIDNSVTTLIDNSSTTENPFDPDDIWLAIGDHTLQIGSDAPTTGDSHEDRIAALEELHEDSTLAIYAFASQEEAFNWSTPTTSWAEIDFSGFNTEEDPNDIISYDTSTNETTLTDGIWKVSLQIQAVRFFGTSSATVIYGRIRDPENAVTYDERSQALNDGSSNSGATSVWIHTVVDARGVDKKVNFHTKRGSSGSPRLISATATYHQIG